MTPQNPSVASGLTEQFTATGIYTDNSAQNLTSAVTCASSVRQRREHQQCGRSNALASAAALGTSNISATLNGVTSPSLTLTVTAATLVSISGDAASPEHRERADGAVHRHRNLHR